MASGNVIETEQNVLLYLLSHKVSWDHVVIFVRHWWISYISLCFPKFCFEKNWRNNMSVPSPSLEVGAPSFEVDATSLEVDAPSLEVDAPFP